MTEKRLLNDIVPLILGCHRYKYSRDVVNDRRHILCGGSRFCQAEGIQLEKWNGFAGSHTNFAGSIFESSI
jgi:hypothetical protein